jgi:hypothetical protein
MVRKAVRAGLARDFYLKQGAEVPTAERVAQLKAMGKDMAFSEWKQRHGQHCWAHHTEPGGCTRERTCAFLHADAAAKVVADEAVWFG